MMGERKGEKERAQKERQSKTNEVINYYYICDFMRNKIGIACIEVSR